MAATVFLITSPHHNQFFAEYVRGFLPEDKSAADVLKYYRDKRHYLGPLTGVSLEITATQTEKMPTETYIEYEPDDNHPTFPKVGGLTVYESPTGSMYGNFPLTWEAVRLDKKPAIGDIRHPSGVRFAETHCALPERFFLERNTLIWGDTGECYNPEYYTCQFGGDFILSGQIYLYAQPQQVSLVRDWDFLPRPGRQTWALPALRYCIPFSLPIARCSTGQIITPADAPVAHAEKTSQNEDARFKMLELD